MAKVIAHVTLVVKYHSDQISHPQDWDWSELMNEDDEIGPNSEMYVKVMSVECSDAVEV